MIPVASCAVLLSIASLTVGRPLPLTQLNHPVIAPGQIGTLAIRIPHYEGSNTNYVGYSAEVTHFSPRQSGYRALAVECPPRFLSNMYSEARGAACYRNDSSPHPSAVMFVTTLNEDAPAGVTHLPEGLRVFDLSAPSGNQYPLRLYSPERRTSQASIQDRGCSAACPGRQAQGLQCPPLTLGRIRPSVRG